jgi:hypothetical protein
MSEPTLTEFLLARIAEDESDAHRAAGGGGYGWDAEPLNHHRAPNSAIDAHIARHDPARVLAECAAKRRIVEIHRMVKFTDVSIGLLDVDVCCICHGMLDVDGDLEHMVNVQQPFPCSTIRALAAIYADSPEFREEWR